MANLNIISWVHQLDQQILRFGRAPDTNIGIILESRVKVKLMFNLDLGGEKLQFFETTSTFEKLQQIGC